jgi:hypothetical protein
MAHMKSGWMSWSGMALVAAVVLGGCAMSDEKAASLMVAPGDYDLYSCPQLAVAAAPLRKRRTELQGLMARADVDAGGRMMSTIGYRPEYLKISGELHSIDATAREKKCDLSAVPVDPDAPAVTTAPPTPALPAAPVR